MTIRHFLAILFVTGAMLGSPLHAQGVFPRWEVIELAENVVTQTDKVEQILLQVRPKEWLQDGAPQAYVNQHESLTTELGHLKASAQDLSRNPQKLIAVVDTFLWFDRTRSMISSLSAGIRSYQNAPVADMLNSAAASYAGPEQKLKEYMRQLVVQRETEMEIAYSEAQRCRERLAKQPRR